MAGIVADEARCRQYAESTPALATILDTVIGYAKASEVVQRAYQTKRPLQEVAVELGYLTRAQADKLLRPEALMQPED